jgi:hypothetical protein
MTESPPQDIRHSHTPGPWDYHGRATMYATPHSDDEISLIEVRARINAGGWDTVAFVEAIWPGARANARLIAAAPELLEALESAIDGLRNPTAHPRAQEARIKKARAAIAKATSRNRDWRSQ